VPDDKPTEDQACNTSPCSSTNASSLSDDVTPDNSTVRRYDVTHGNDRQLYTTTSADDVTIMAPSVPIASAAAKTSTVIPSSAALAQTTTTSATTTNAATTTTTATTTNARDTVTTRRPLTSYRWMALFWDQVFLHVNLLYLVLKIKQFSLYCNRLLCLILSALLWRVW